MIDDPVNHPPHYTISTAECPGCERTIECIDVTRHLNFNIGNAIKYLWRHEFKNGKEDLRKAIWYIRDELRETESEKESTLFEGMKFALQLMHNVESVFMDSGVKFEKCQNPFVVLENEIIKHIEKEPNWRQP